jgi:hypothetical protein
MTESQRAELKEVFAQVTQNMAQVTSMQEVKPFVATNEYMDLLREQRRLIGLRNKMLQDNNIVISR